jgi:DNA-binding SARP family transcriptional activator
MWPDAESDTSHRSFATTLHRLRRLLGANEALQVQDGTLTLDARYCWVDAWSLERLLGQAHVLWREHDAAGDTDRAAVLAERAIALYTGPFLPQEVDAPWTIAYRERLRSKFVRGVEGLGRRLEQEGRWEGATEQYRKAIEADPFVEEFYRRLMTCHRHLGRKSEALATYDRCRKVLWAVFRIEPSEATEAIGRLLRAD